MLTWGSAPFAYSIDNIATAGSLQGNSSSKSSQSKNGVASGAASGYLLPPMAPQLDTTVAPSPAAPDTVSNSTSTGSAPSTPDDNQDFFRRQLQLASSLYAQGRVQEAEAAFKRVLLFNNRCVDAYYNLGVIAEGRSDLQGALYNYRIACRLSPNDPELRSAVTAVENKLRYPSTAPLAAPNFRQQAELKGLVQDAQVAYKAGSYDRAIGELQQVAAQDPNDASVFYALSQAYKAKGQVAPAKYYLSRALALDPHNSLYTASMHDLDTNTAGSSAIASSGISANNQGGDQISGSAGSVVPFSGDLYAGSSGSNTAYGANTGTGVTPFTSSGEQQLVQDHVQQGSVWGYGSGYSAFGSSGSTRLTRAVIGGLGGMAAGAMFGSMTHYGARRSAMSGALIGGFMGLLMGR